VALLQVAQAVVSSPDLVDALGAIVRITPILAGVDRAVVFLWNPSRQSFSSVQSYGTAHDSALFEYKSGEFPLLDAVLETNRLMVYPLIRDKDIFKDAPDDWSFLIPPDLDEIEILLDEADRLLLALPLSVKGDILGVLLVEEPIPAHTLVSMVDPTGGCGASAWRFSLESRSSLPWLFRMISCSTKWWNASAWSVNFSWHARSSAPFFRRSFPNFQAGV
jgi:GAF domain-containing protein